MSTSEKTSMRKVVGASMVGTTIEWYDFFLYGSAAALIFNKLFFPESDPLVGTMLAFLTYSVGFVARPVGGIVFGHFGDRLGRKNLLMLSLLLMGGSTFLIGLLPTYATLGTTAAVLLVTLRFIQGFAIGGEWGGAVLLVAEHGDVKRRGFWASLPQAGAPAGNLLATAVMWILSFALSEAQFLSWGWRIPFLLSAILVVLGYYIRMQVEESPVFQEARERTQKSEVKERAPLLEVFRYHRREVACGIAARFVENVSYYLVTAFSLAYAANQLGVKQDIVLAGLLAANAVHLFAIPLFGALSDRVGRRPVYLAGAIGMGCYGFVLFPLLETRNTWLIALGLIGGLFLHAVMFGPQAAFFTEMFSTRMRYSGASFVYQATNIIAGGLAPFIALALITRYDTWEPVALYMLGAGVISVIGVLVARETRGVDLADDEPSAHSTNGDTETTQVPVSA